MSSDLTASIKPDEPVPALIEVNITPKYPPGGNDELHPMYRSSGEQSIINAPVFSSRVFPCTTNNFSGRNMNQDKDPNKKTLVSESSNEFVALDGKAEANVDTVSRTRTHFFVGR